MIQVLEHGTRKITCPNCKAKLSYSIDDVQEKTVNDLFDGPMKYQYIICPDCEMEIILNPVKR